MSGYEATESPISLGAGLNNTGSDLADGVAVMIDSGDPGSYPPKIKLPAATTSPVWGVTRGIIPNGEVGSVLLLGQGRVVAGGAVNPGDKLTAQTTGKVTAAAPAGGTNTNLVGIARTGGVLNDVIEYHS